MKNFSLLLLFGSLLSIPVAAHAQGGIVATGNCTDSPECPTAILGLIGAAGAALYVRLRSR